MTVLLTELAPSLQKLVDARLDNIDRALLSTDVSRYERRQIVAAVEDQIQELVARIDRDEASREDILRILASLDPPEAYGSGSMQSAIEYEYEGQQESSRFPRRRLSSNIEPKVNTLAIVSVTLATLSLFSIPGFLVLGFIASFLSAVTSLAALVCGIVSLCQCIYSKPETYGKWMAIVGIVSFPVALVLMFLFYAILESL